MSRRDPHLAFEELAAGHALAALEPEEEQLFLQHVTGCARCERDVAEHEATLAQLAYAPDAAEPPPSLLKGIRAGVLASGRGASFPAAQDGDTGREEAADDAAQSVAAVVPVPPAVRPMASLEEGRARRDGHRRRRAGTWLGVAAAAALVISLGAWNASLQRDRAEQAEWSGRMAAAVSQLGDAGTSTIPLAGSDGQVVAVVLVHDAELSLVVDGLEPNEDGTTYVLWAKSRYGDVRPVGAFDVASGELDVLDGLLVEEGIADVTTFMVSREQGDTAPPMPQSAVLASGEST